MKRSKILAGSAIALVGVLGAPITGAHADVGVHDIASGFAGPLQIAVASSGSIYVAQSFSGTLTELHGSSRRDIAQVAGEIGGVSVVRPGDVNYTTTIGDPQAGTTTATTLNRRQGAGNDQVVADLWTYEQTQNPDQHQSYGFQGLDPACASQVPPEIGGDSYTGVVDSHPYATATASNGLRFVADAAGNDILRVDPTSGAISTLTVLPPQPHTISAGEASSLGLPDCTVGKTYNFEPVPTDVEIGPDHMLYVSTLPGGPEDASLGARGSVYRIDRSNGNATKIATGFLGATNLAVAPDGTIYVSELFANQVSKVVNGGPQVYASVNEPAGLEYANGKLYVAYNTFSNGTVATLG